MNPPPNLYRPIPIWLFIGLGSLWIILVMAGFSVLAKEQFTPVTNLQQAEAFPSTSAVKLDPFRPTLLLFAHPQCPCTTASFSELDGLLASVQGKVLVVILFTIPPGVSPGWETGNLWQTAANMPGVQVFRDQDGGEAVRFGARGSGQVFLYNPSGQLLFRGGITDSRGHEGDNAGRSAVINWVLQGHSLVTRTPVFGCSLL